jgi:hypothetical protein
MKVKKIIALICLVVLSIQVLPLKQIGAILFNNQMTEEIAHGVDGGKKMSGEKEMHHCFYAVLNTTGKELAVTNNQSIYSRSRLVKLHIAEVPTPPPNI